jgi:hypothetical protein
MQIRTPDVLRPKQTFDAYRFLLLLLSCSHAIGSAKDFATIIVRVKGASFTVICSAHEDTLALQAAVAISFA